MRGRMRSPLASDAARGGLGADGGASAAPAGAPPASAQTLLRLSTLPASLCDAALVSGGASRPVLGAAVAAASPVLRAALPRTQSLHAPVPPRLLDALASLLHAQSGPLADLPTADLWDLAAALRALRAVPALHDLLAAELARRDDAVDVDSVFEALAAAPAPTALFRPAPPRSTTDGASASASSASAAPTPGERARLRAARRLLRTSFVSLTSLESWPRQPAATVERVLRMNDLALPHGELDAFRALLRWARDPANDHADAVSLLRLIRFPTMSDRDLLAAVRSDVFARDDVFYRMVLEAFVRRAEARVLHAPRNDARRSRPSAPKYGSAVSDALLIHRATPNAPVSPARLNARHVRTAAFKGTFPLPLYRHMRFRARSEHSLLFTAVVPNWSACTDRIRTESRDFADHRWSIWIDPIVDAAHEDVELPASPGTTTSAVPTASANGSPVGSPSHGRGTPVQSRAGQRARASSPRGTTHAGYISMYLCCHSDLGTGDREVDVTIDYSLFVASAADPYVMERKVCPSKSFSSHGQASGFRLHTRRALLMDTEAGLYDPERDELVVGAHIVGLPSGPTPDSLDEPVSGERLVEPPTEYAVGTAWELQRDATLRRAVSYSAAEVGSHTGNPMFGSSLAPSPAGRAVRSPRRNMSPRGRYSPRAAPSPGSPIAGSTLSTM